jgi:hypothetical protein
MDDAGVQRRSSRGRRLQAPHSFIPIRPSVTAMRMSWQPRALKSAKTFIPNVPPPCGRSRARACLACRPAGWRARQIAFAAHHRRVPNLDAERIEEDHRIDRDAVGFARRSRRRRHTAPSMVDAMHLQSLTHCTHDRQLFAPTSASSWHQPAPALCTHHRSSLHPPSPAHCTCNQSAPSRTSYFQRRYHRNNGAHRGWCFS